MGLAKAIKRGASALLIGSMMTGLFTGCSATGENSGGKLVKIAVCVSDQTPAAQALADVFKPMVEEATDGRYDIQIYNSGVLGSEKVTYDYTKSGIVEMCVVGTTMWSETPKMSIPDFPFLFDSVEHARVCYQGELGEYIAEDLESTQPLKLLSWYPNGAREFTSNKKLESLDDFNGQKLRMPNNPIHVKLAESLSLLLQGKEVQSIINTDIIYPEVNADSDTIYSFLLVAGYLRVTSVISEFNDNPICSLKLPNREIKSVFQKEILDNYNTLFNGSLLRDFELALRTGDTALFTDTLQKYLLQSASTFDTTNENFYHGTVFGMLAILSDRYYISSNRESGEGRFDIQLEPKDKSQLGYIIEFKAGKNLSDTELANSASSAIQQIQSKKYSTDMEYHGIKKIGLFGIAFSGKRVAAKYAELASSVSERFFPALNSII
jgi:hypothetical protein